MNATISQRPIDAVMHDLVAWREAGYVKTVGKLLDEAKSNPDGGSAANEIADHQTWFDWATEHEHEHGVYSLVDERHPVHLRVMEIVNSVKAWSHDEADAIAG
ncbi:hypothetical protein [Mesorhizobium sp. M4B.F.Ca.ET.049.02.1.2]|uniref:hypothetical protein n=1 Tax=Mesorhizobium sp. M4B.F.Ca.ET.049.02.1.2 TaxID=2496752 RepID=UPI000FCADF0C|nr:hypothetical protein [Mesorhizobium sp. M4B.F.Ca.ET.049.02.1.2]RUW75952.1 hypothetical protein EOA31_07960 [Mesorhizobium sp. M4B.F.Ca.ET.049.02.1.2]